MKTVMPSILNEDEKKLYDNAMVFARSNKKKIAKKWVDSFISESNPVSVFMAGSPGAGKTEEAKELVNVIGENILRIDNDDLRNEFTEYNGNNSHIFQLPATRLVEAIHDKALKSNVSFILDTTLSNYEKAKQNIERSLNKNRKIAIIFVYQAPENAWGFVLARQKTEGRRVPPEVFIKQFISSQDVVNKLKNNFGELITIELIIKNLDGSRRIYHSNVNTVDEYINKRHTESQLKEIVGLQ